MSTIVDSNVTTLISTLVLFWLGSGPVRGFAVTLTIGILASMFTAVTVTRLMVVYWLRRTRPAMVPI
jgi:preprotein translocase subunit SecD